MYTSHSSFTKMPPVVSVFPCLVQDHIQECVEFRLSCLSVFFSVESIPQSFPCFSYLRKAFHSIQPSVRTVQCFPMTRLRPCFTGRSGAMLYSVLSHQETYCVNMFHHSLSQVGKHYFLHYHHYPLSVELVFCEMFS